MYCGILINKKTGLLQKTRVLNVYNNVIEGDDTDRLIPEDIEIPGGVGLSVITYGPIYCDTGIYVSITGGSVSYQVLYDV